MSDELKPQRAIHESAGKMAKELLQHAIGDQQEIMQDFINEVLRARKTEAENKSIDAKNFEEYYDNFKNLIRSLLE